VKDGEWHTFALCAGAVCIAVVVVRIAWIMFHTAVDRWRLRRSGRRTSPEAAPTFRAATLSSWCGMRGIVTLAAALALPETPSAFPHRDLIVFCAFCVVLTTLVLQGVTLRPLMQWLGLHDDGTVEREISIARAETARAALRVLEQDSQRSPSADMLRREYEARLQADDSGEAVGVADQEDTSLAALQLKTVSAQREALTALRAHHEIGDDAFHVVEEEIALLELTADSRVRPTIEWPGPDPGSE
jgi:CPA1 family monovalent cation:H+ antiporter